MYHGAVMNGIAQTNIEEKILEDDERHSLW